MLWTAGLAAPFVALVAVGLAHLLDWQLPPAAQAGNDLMGRLGGALTVVSWNFCGWENLSVVAAEIKDPQRNYLRAVTVAVPAVALGYILPLAVCLQGLGSGASWHTGSFAEQGMRIGGPLLGTGMAMGGARSSVSIFEAARLWISPLPVVPARQPYLAARSPSRLARRARAPA